MYVFPENASAFDSAVFMKQHPEMEGRVWKTTSFKDAKGENFIFLNTTGNYTSRPSNDEEICTNSDIFAYGYRSGGDAEPVLLWKMHDFIHDCFTSATCEFSSDSPVITDLDKNGIQEVWMTVYIGCRGDVGPVGMKILMYENGKKYALRGETFVHVDDMDLGGTYKADPEFTKAPAVFLQFADRLWQKNKNQ